MDWLLTGEGSMLRGSEEQGATESEDAALREEVVMLRERVRNLQEAYRREGTHHPHTEPPRLL